MTGPRPSRETIWKDVALAAILVGGVVGLVVAVGLLWF